MTVASQPTAVRRVVLLAPDGAGGYTPVTLFERLKTRKKRSRKLRPIERAVRQIADATATSANSYADRHRRSNVKKRDGWLKDLRVNVKRARKRGAKRIKISRILTA